MNCPDLETLSRFQDGGLDKQTARTVQEHLLVCPSCRQRFAMLGKAGLYLRVTVGSRKNTPCLTPEETGAYLAGRVSRKHRRRIEAHLASCRRCLHEVATLSNSQFIEPTASSPRPTRRVVAGFAELVKVRPRRRRMFLPRLVGAAAAAALLLALVIPMTVERPGMPETVGPVDVAISDNRVVEGADSGFIELAMAEDRELLGDQHELTRFARETGLILRQVVDAARAPTEDRVALLQEDVLNSGLVNTVGELTGQARDVRTRRFLSDCEYVLMKVVRVNKGDASRDLELIVGEIRRMNLIPTARLIELEGGRSLWLAAL